MIDISTTELIKKLLKINMNDFSTIGGKALILELIKESARRLDTCSSNIENINEKNND